MIATQTHFQAVADAVVEWAITQAELIDVKLELYFCLQQVPDNQTEVGLSYLLRNGEHDVFLATDAKGRMWYCDCAQREAREFTPNTDFLTLSEKVLGALGCTAVSAGRAISN